MAKARKQDTQIVVEDPAYSPPPTESAETYHGEKPTEEQLDKLLSDDSDDFSEVTGAGFAAGDALPEDEEQSAYAAGDEEQEDEDFDDSDDSNEFDSEFDGDEEDAPDSDDEQESEQQMVTQNLPHEPVMTGAETITKAQPHPSSPFSLADCNAWLQNNMLTVKYGHEYNPDYQGPKPKVAILDQSGQLIGAGTALELACHNAGMRAVNSEWSDDPEGVDEP